MLGTGSKAPFERFTTSPDNLQHFVMDRGDVDAKYLPDESIGAKLTSGDHVYLPDNVIYPNSPTVTKIVGGWR